MVTLAGQATVPRHGVTATVPTHIGPAVAGLHPAVGGDGSEACSGDMLMEALVACAGVTLRSVATSMQMDVAGTIKATAEWDSRYRRVSPSVRPSPNERIRGVGSEQCLACHM